MKRPLCMVCLIFVVCMIWFGTQIKGPPFYLTEMQKNADYYMGQIQKKEYKNNQIYLYLSNVVFLSPNSDVSNQIKMYQKKNSQIGCVCYLELSETVDEETWATEPKIGSIVLIQGNAVDFLPASNLGMFDQKEYYLGMGLYFAVYQGEIFEASSEYSVIKEELFQVRKKIAAILTEELGEKNGGVLRAMLLGDKEQLSQELKEGYQYSGIAHILAISGLHISIIGFGLFEILRRCKLPGIIAAFVSFTFLIAYGAMIGGSTASIRAIIMFLMFMGAKISKRPYDIVTALAVAGSILIASKAGNMDAGFLLSFGAIMGLVFLPNIFYGLFPKWMRKKIGGILKAFVSGCSVFIATIPILTIYYFGIAPLSIFVNLLVIPLMTILITCGVFLIMTSVSVPFLSFLFRIPCEFILLFYEKIILVSEIVPGYFLVTGKPENWRVMLYYGLLFLFVIIKKKIWMKIRCGILVVMFGILLIRVQPNLQITVLDVGQGDGIYIETGTGYSMFVDGGSTTVNEVGKYRIASYLKAKGVSKIDYLFFTHYDQDHICGWIELFSEMLESSQKSNILQVTNIVISKETKDSEGGEELLSLARKLGIQICMMEQGDVMDFRGVTLRCIYPGDKLTESANANSLVLLINKDDFSILLTGDLEGEGEEMVTEELQKLYKNNERESIEVLKVGHHGSANASTYEFLEEVGASIGVISYGADNSYGHPAKITLERLQDEGMLYLGTGTDGAVLIESDGKCYWVESYLRK